MKPPTPGDLRSYKVSQSSNCDAELKADLCKNIEVIEMIGESCWPYQVECSEFCASQQSIPIFRVTDSILAMARPSSELLEKYHIIEQFLG